jgi:hypothetical protein
MQMFERFGFIASSEEFDGDGIIYFEIWLSPVSEIYCLEKRMILCKLLSIRLLA